MPNDHKPVLLFPGQGSQRVGMGKELFDAFPESRSVVEEADEILGFALSKVCFEGPEDELRRTENTQPALYVHSMAALRAMESGPGDWSGVAGHSLGEWTAVAASGALSFADGLRLVRRRGQLMEAAGRERPGTMAAVLGLSAEQTEQACAEVRKSTGGTVVLANLNSPAQFVISGDIPAVEEAMKAAETLGARKVVPLPVGGAFHSPLMGSAAEGLKEALAAVKLRRAGVPIVANVSASFVQEPDEIRAALEQQLLGAVRWQASMETLLEAGARTFVEVGSGKVLSGLMRQIDRSAACSQVGEPNGVEAWAAGNASTA